MTGMIMHQLRANRISMAQIDPNGMCNSSCWFCPVGYERNPAKGRMQMSAHLFESIIRGLTESKGSMVSYDFNGIYTAHYNEVFMYRYLPQMLEILRDYGLGTVILSNGVLLVKRFTDLILEYRDVVRGLCLNIPAAESQTWSLHTGFEEALFDVLLTNIRYFLSKGSEYVKSRAFSIQMNGINESSHFARGGWLDGMSCIETIYPKGNLRTQYRLLKTMFPKVAIYEMPHLVDRAGILETYGVFSNRRAIEVRLKRNKSKVIGCGNGVEVGGRPFGWIHVNAVGEVFLCCNDFRFDFTFGNLREESLADIWLSQRHLDAIREAFQTICRRCVSAIWG
ncbi:MAG: SPASM domain-containing protein [Candidatus Thorarchaeota archaeon]|jgi:MoaA/NifB/PqqE/SkfB family radical SAM enzyme